VISIRDDSPRWKEINVSAWEHERAGLAHIRALLPDADPYFAWANVEFLASDSSINEIDLLVLTPSGLHLLELKHWQGEISGDGFRWEVRSPNGRTRSEDNPVILANRKARRLASLLEHYNRQSGKRSQVPFIRAAIFLHAPGLRTHLDALGRQRVYGLNGALLRCGIAERAGPDRWPGQIARASSVNAVATRSVADASMASS
jgi:Nuclease-related domain